MTEITERMVTEFLRNSRDVEMVERIVKVGNKRILHIEKMRKRLQLSDGDKLKLQGIIKELAPKLAKYRKEGERLSQGMAERMLHAMAYDLLKDKTMITKVEYARVMRYGKPDDLRKRLVRAERSEDIIRFKGALRKFMKEEEIII